MVAFLTLETILFITFVTGTFSTRIRIPGRLTRRGIEAPEAGTGFVSVEEKAINAVDRGTRSFAPETNDVKGKRGWVTSKSRPKTGQHPALSERVAEIYNKLVRKKSSQEDHTPLEVVGPDSWWHPENMRLTAKAFPQNSPYRYTQSEKDVPIPKENEAEQKRSRNSKKEAGGSTATSDTTPWKAGRYGLSKY
ncbi:hypothetical protein FRB96_008024 [Tulasnella sp. 330]|nr:hypothetical protein FRB96_008024 [Tulasnella sp. 330]